MAAWYGSKATTGLCQAIVAAMPPHDVYIEAFLGGGAIMKRKPPVLRSIGIDLNRRAIDTFRCDHPVELHHDCALRFLATFAFQGRELVYCDPCSRRAGRSAATASTARTTTMLRSSYLLTPSWVLIGRSAR